MNEEQKSVLIQALTLLDEMLSSPTSADRADNPEKADRDIEVARGLINDLESHGGQGDDLLATILAKSQELDAVIDELGEMGFAEDEPINGGDCVDTVATIYERLTETFPRD